MGKVAEKSGTGTDSLGWKPGMARGEEGGLAALQTHHLMMQRQGCWAAAL